MLQWRTSRGPLVVHGPLVKNPCLLSPFATLFWRLVWANNKAEKIPLRQKQSQNIIKKKTLCFLLPKLFFALTTTTTTKKKKFLSRKSPLKFSLFFTTRKKYPVRKRKQKQGSHTLAQKQHSSSGFQLFVFLKSSHLLDLPATHSLICFSIRDCP